MTKALIFGGTGWLGCEIATQLVANGDDVTCLARGESGAAAEGVTLFRTDRTGIDAYAALSAEPWDDVIELSSEPSFVRRQAREPRPCGVPLDICLDRFRLCQPQCARRE